MIQRHPRSTEGRSSAASDGYKGQGGGVPQGPPGIDDSGRGNGTIGVGTAPSAGEAGFTGNAPQIEE